MFLAAGVPPACAWLRSLPTHSLLRHELSLARDLSARLRAEGAGRVTVYGDAPGSSAEQSLAEYSVEVRASVARS